MKKIYLIVHCLFKVTPAPLGNLSVKLQTDSYPLIFERNADYLVKNILHISPNLFELELSFSFTTRRRLLDDLILLRV